METTAAQNRNQDESASSAGSAVMEDTNSSSYMQRFLTIVTMLLEPIESDDEIERVAVESLRSDDIGLFLTNRNTRNCVLQYIEIVVPSYREEEFRHHFRISRSLFESLEQRFRSSETYINLREDKRLSAETHLLVFLWFAGHEACSFRDLGDRFNICIATVSRIVNRVTMFISSLSPDVIKWPTQQQKRNSSEYFSRKCFFSKAIGCIDGTHIQIDPPKRSKDDYINRKGFTSICLQAICNEQKKFIHIFVGYPGSCHDSWGFRNSTISDNLPSYCGDFYLLGDSAYPCNQYLITPYKNNGHLTAAQKLFYIKLSSGRIVVEHSFGILKQRFRQLFYCKLKGMEKLCHFARACCVLHNIANEEDLDFNLESIDVADDSEVYGEISRGNNVRDPICQEIQMRRTT